MPKEKLINDTYLTTALDKAKRYTDNVTAPMIDETEAKTLIRDSFNDQQIWFKDFVTEEGLEDLRVSEDMTESEVQSKIYWYTPKKKFYAPNPQKGFFTAYAPYSFRRVTSKIFFCQANSKFYRFDPITLDLVEAYPESTTPSDYDLIKAIAKASLPEIAIWDKEAGPSAVSMGWAEFQADYNVLKIGYYIWKKPGESLYRVYVLAKNLDSRVNVYAPLTTMTNISTASGYLREGLVFRRVYHTHTGEWYDDDEAVILHKNGNLLVKYIL